MTTDDIKKLKPLLGVSFNLKETYKQLTVNKNTFFSWGVSKILNLFGEGMILKVNGNHHKGYVMITLNGMDLYDVYILNNKFDVIETYNSIYCDILSEVIDNRIERIPSYKN